MLYELGSRGLTPCGVHENEKRNNLPIGTVLQLNGYNYTKYVIIKNLGINNKYSYYGATYLCVSLDDFTQGQKQAHEFKHITQKKDDRIAIYYTDEIKTSEEVLDLWEKSEAKRKNTEAREKLAQENRQRLIEQGKALFAKHIPQDAKALIIAEHDQDESDIQTDYFGHSTIETVILGYSMSTRDNFKEMRKLCNKIPETKHLSGGHFEPKVIIGADIKNNGSYYNEGQFSHWHHELTDKNGHQIVFSTKEETKKYILEKGQPESISFDGILIPFRWEIREESLEHREKYSMGAGYYLKDGWSNSTGWCVKKIRNYRSGNAWNDDIYIAMAKRCIF